MELTPADLHTHSTFSDGTTTLEQIAAIAGSAGMAVGVADHCGPGSFQLDSDERFRRYFEAVSRHPVYRSVELDLGREINVSRENLKRCDYLIGGVHSLGGRDFFDGAQAWTDIPGLLDGILAAIDEKARIFDFDILAHPGLLPASLRSRQSALLDSRWDQRLIGLALEHGFALEISSRWQVPSAGTIRRAAAAGVTFALGSDAHRPEQVCRLDHSLSLAAACGLTDADLFRPARQLAEKIA